MKKENVYFRRHENEFKVTFHALVTIDSLHEIKAHIDSSIPPHTELLLFDLSHFSHVNSTLLSLIVYFYKRMETEGGVLYLLNVSDEMERLFTASQLEILIPIYRSEKEFRMAQHMMRMQERERKNNSDKVPPITDKGEP